MQPDDRTGSQAVPWGYVVCPPPVQRARYKGGRRTPPHQIAGKTYGPEKPPRTTPTRNMKYVLVLAAVLAVAAARPQEKEKKKEKELMTPEEYGLLRSSHVTNEDGSFQYGYETSDPSSQDVTGQFKEIDDKIVTVLEGTYSFTAKDDEGNDVEVRVDWVADENGFQAQSASLPQAPEDPNAEAQAAAQEKFSKIEAEKKEKEKTKE